jgi:DNA-binding transcriptional MerR regulator
LGSPQDLVKLYYRIGEVAHIVGVEPHVLRYWESEFRSIRPQKSHKGQRVYSRKDVVKLLKVKDLLKNQGFTIAGARKKLREPGVAETEEVRAERPSSKVREALVSIREDIVRLLDEIDSPPRRPKLPST